MRCFGPETIHASCEDYRAAATIDLVHDEADLDLKVRCPLLTLSGAKGAMDALYDVPATWRGRATSVRGGSIPGGHLLPEQSPDALLAELLPPSSEMSISPHDLGARHGACFVPRSLLRSCCSSRRCPCPHPFAALDGRGYPPPC